MLEPTTDLLVMPTRSCAQLEGRGHVPSRDLAPGGAIPRALTPTEPGLSCCAPGRVQPDIHSCTHTFNKYSSEVY